MTTGWRPLHQLTELENQVLSAVAKAYRLTPDDVATAVCVSRQRAVHVANLLEGLGLLKVRRLPKQTSYTVTDEGRRYLP
jgi:predicted transcriptional regulator